MKDFIIQNDVLISYHGKESHVIIPQNITKIATDAFNNNKHIEHIVINDEIDYIGCRAFADCTRMKSITFPIWSFTKISIYS